MSGSEWAKPTVAGKVPFSYPRFPRQLNGPSLSGCTMQDEAENLTVTTRTLVDAKREVGGFHTEKAAPTVAPRSS